MKPAPGMPDQNQRPLSWDDLPQGEWLMEQVASHLAVWWPRLYGQHLVKLGELSVAIPSFGSRINHQIGICETAGTCGLVARLEALPLAECSVDLTLLTHCLEYHPTPQQVVREAARITAPYGHVVIVGFNPLSLVGASRWLPGYRKKLPWRGNFIPPKRVSDWLQLLGFEVIADERLVYTRLGGRHHSRWQQWCETLGGNYWPNLGGVYVLVARKHVVPVTPSRRPAVFRRRLVPVGAAQACSQPRATRSQHSLD